MLLLGAGTFSAQAAGLTAQQIQAVLSLLASFGADATTIANVQAALTGAPTEEVPPISCDVGTSALTIGSSGAAVTNLQRALIVAGYAIPAGATGYYGAQTQAAVAAWQRAAGIVPANGYFGAASREAFNLCKPVVGTPTISGVSGPTSLQVGQQGTWSVTASDPNNGTLSYSVAWGDALGGAAASTGAPVQQTATFTHVYSQASTYTPTFYVTNSTGKSAKTSVSVVVGLSTAQINSIVNLLQAFGSNWSTIGTVYADLGGQKNLLSSRQATSVLNMLNAFGAGASIIGYVYHDIGGTLPTAFTSTAMLSATQINSVAGLMSSFGADPSTIGVVYTDLGGQRKPLTSNQINAIVSLLRSFGAVESMISQVEADLKDSLSVQPSITIISPSAFQLYRPGDRMVVKWTTQNVPSYATFDSMRLRNVNDGQEYSLETRFSNSGEWTLQVPSVPAGTYQLDIKWLMAEVEGGGVMIGSSAQFTIAPASVQPSYSVYDYNNDGAVNAADSQYLANVAMGSVVCPSGKTCDVNGDGMVNVSDVLSLTTLINNGATAAITVVSPNGGETWRIGDKQTVLWKPYDAAMGINTVANRANNTPGVTAALEQLVNGQFVLVGGMIRESGEASILWGGDLNWGDNRVFQVSPGTYYVKVTNGKTGQWDRSDAPFTIATSTPTYSAYDYNNDTLVNGMDVGTLMQVALGNQTCQSGKICDMDSDNRVTVSDIQQLVNLVLNGSNPYDYSNNGVIDKADVDYLTQVLLGNRSCPSNKNCDVNNDRSVNVADSIALANMLGVTVSTQPSITSISSVRASADSVVIYGLNLISGGGNTTVEFYAANGTFAGSVPSSYIDFSLSPQEILFHQDATYASDGSPVNLQPGTYQVDVLTSAGRSNKLPFVINAPTTYTSDGQVFAKGNSWTLRVPPIAGAQVYLMNLWKIGENTSFWENNASDHKWSYDGTYTIDPSNPKYQEVPCNSDVKFESRGYTPTGWTDNRWVTIHVACPSTSYVGGASQTATVLGAVSGLTASTPAPQSRGGFQYTWNNNLQIGSPYMNDVKALQTALVFESVYYGDVTGGFYNETFAAVQRFQQKYGIEATGFVGPETRAKLNALY